MEIINWAIANADSVFAILSGLLGTALLIVKLTPSTKDDEIVGGAMAALQKVAGIFKPKA